MSSKRVETEDSSGSGRYAIEQTQREVTDGQERSREVPQRRQHMNGRSHAEAR